jgi:hypothetical protein
MEGIQMRKTTLAALAAIAISSAGCDDGSAHAVSGTITLPPERVAKLGASDTLFILARPAGQQAGPPLAVLKMVGMKFPLHYELGQEDVLMPGKFFTGQVQVQAVLRKSGIATLPVPGDVRGAYGKPVEPGAKNVDIALDTPDEGPVKASR